MNYLRILSVAAGAFAICASSASAQTITANFEGFGSYDKVYLNSIDGRTTYGHAWLEFSSPVANGVDLNTSYDWEITGSVNVRVDVAGIAGANYTNLGTFSIELPKLYVDSVSPLAGYLMTWGSSTPYDLTPHGLDAQLDFGPQWQVTAHLFEENFHQEAFAHYGLPQVDLRYAQFTFLDGALTATAVPEPATVGAIAVFGLLGAVVLRRRFKKAA